MFNVSNLLNAVFIVPLIGMLFVLSAKDKDKNSNLNVFSVGIFTVISNLVLLWIIAQNIDISKPGWQMLESFAWLENPKIELVFGLDIFSLMLMAAVHFAILLGMLGVKNNSYRQKSLIAFSLLFLSMICGYLSSTDLFSFYIYYEAMLLPLFMLIGIFGDIKKYPVIYRFFIYNLLGAVFLFMALMILYSYDNVDIRDASNVILTRNIEMFVWSAIFIAFLSRIPVWPFHYWISSVNANISNPLVFIVANIVPLTGVYGLIRFFPVNAPEILSPYVLILEILSVVTMVMIALIGFVNKDVQYKLFSYITVYYIFFLLGALLPTNALLINIGYSLFSFIIIVSAVAILVSLIEHARESSDVSGCGILCNVKRISFVLSFLVLAGVGLPLSSLFLNNLVIFAGLFKFNIKLTVFILFAVVLSSISLLYQLFYWKYPDEETSAKSVCMTDISIQTFSIIMGVIIVLLLSLINPLWFIA